MSTQAASRQVRGADEVQVRRRLAPWRLLLRDRVALAAGLWLVLLVLCAALGPALLGDAATAIDLRARNTPPGSLEKGALGVLGTDALGRSMLARLVVAARNTLMIAASAVVIALVAGGILGMVAGYAGGRIGNLIMRLADVLQSFPSLLTAVVVLYVLEPRVANLVLVLALTRLPVYVRVARAEVLEIRERLFVEASRAFGASTRHVMIRHIAPVVLPTLLTILSVEFAVVMLAESSLSFLGIGIQPPEITWGLMVAQGRNHLANAWWLSFLPGLAIMLAAMAANVLSGWLRMVGDPAQRWRLEMPRGPR